MDFKQDKSNEKDKKTGSFQYPLVIFLGVVVIVLFFSICIIVFVFQGSRGSDRSSEKRRNSLESQMNLYEYDLTNTKNGIVNFRGVAKMPENRDGVELVFHGDDLEALSISKFSKKGGELKLYEVSMDLFCCPTSLKGDISSIPEECRTVVTGLRLQLEHYNKESARDGLKLTVGMLKKSVDFSGCQQEAEEYLDLDVTGVEEVVNAVYVCKGYCTIGKFSEFFEANRDVVERLSQFFSSEEETIEYVRTNIFEKNSKTCKDTGTQGEFFGDGSSVREIESKFFGDILDVFCSGFHVRGEKEERFDRVYKYVGVCKGDYFGLGCRRKVGMVDMGQKVLEG